ncbi:MAG: uracil-DNA glycosylase [Alphaproteobacteria bacterium]
MTDSFTPPPRDCPLCPRLVAFREANRHKFPKFYNGAVPSFGPLDAEFLIVGLAPGLKGANATGRPFTGDYAGIVLYESLAKHGFARGTYQARPDDGFELLNVRITNAVRCVPPENRPTPQEAKTCNRFLVSEMAAMPRLKLILSLGLTSHQSVVRTLKLPLKDHKFGHGALYEIRAGLRLLSSYHTSRYNVQTGRLTQAMFDTIVATAATLLKR